MTTNTKMKKVSSTIPVSLHDEMVAICKEMNVNVSHFIFMSIKHYVNKLRQEKLNEYIMKNFSERRMK